MSHTLIVVMITGSCLVIGLILLGIDWLAKKRKVSLLTQFATDKGYTYNTTRVDDYFRVDTQFNFFPAASTIAKVDMLSGALSQTQLPFTIKDSPVSLLLAIDRNGISSYAHFRRTQLSVALPASGIEFVLLSKQNTHRMAAQPLRMVKKQERLRLSTRFNRNYNLYVTPELREVVTQLFTEEVIEFLLDHMSNLDVVMSTNGIVINGYDRLYPKNAQPKLDALDSLLTAWQPVLTSLARPTQPTPLQQHGGFFAYMFRQAWPQFVGTIFFGVFYILFGLFAFMGPGTANEKLEAQSVFAFLLVWPAFLIVRYLYYRCVLRLTASASTLKRLLILSVAVCIAVAGLSGVGAVLLTRRDQIRNRYTLDTSAPVTYLEIPELHVKMKLDSRIKDATYSYHEGTVYISTKSVEALGGDCAATKKGMGSIVVFTDENALDTDGTTLSVRYRKASEVNGVFYAYKARYDYCGDPGNLNDDKQPLYQSVYNAFYDVTYEAL